MAKVADWPPEGLSLSEAFERLGIDPGVAHMRARRWEAIQSIQRRPHTAEEREIYTSRRDAFAAEWGPLLDLWRGGALELVASFDGAPQTTVSLDLLPYLRWNVVGGTMTAPTLTGRAIYAALRFRPSAAEQRSEEEAAKQLEAALQRREEELAQHEAALETQRHEEEQRKQRGAARRKQRMANVGGRPRADVTAEAVRTELERRLEAGEPTDLKSLGNHFKVSAQTIADRLQEE